jgi:capsular exopolysaccharide synthesis family protein
MSETGESPETATEMIERSAWVEVSREGIRPAGDGKLVINANISPLAIEQYQRLAAVLHHAQANRRIKTVMVASAVAGEGKSLTATNLALTLSESYGRRVLLIDADLRRPTLHDTFQIPNLAGVSDWLQRDDVGPMPLVEISPKLSLLPGGRPDPDPMAGLASERMKQVIHEASERFDWVILDTPPIGLLPDGSLVAAMVDTVVLVVGAGTTPHAAIQHTIAEIGHARIIGVVLNRVKTTAAQQRYGGYAYYGRPQVAIESGSAESGGTGPVA